MTYRGDTRERLDPDHFLALRDADFQAIRSSIFPIKKLKDLSTLVTKGETPLWRGDSFLNEGIPFLRGKNIKGAIDFDDIVYISDDVHERMKRSILKEDFFLLTIAGTLGDVAFFKKEYPECNINQDIAKIKLTDEISCTSTLSCIFRQGLRIAKSVSYRTVQREDISTLVKSGLSM